MRRTFEWHAELGPLDPVHRHSHHPVRDTVWLLISSLLVAAMLSAAAGPEPVASAAPPSPAVSMVPGGR